MSRIESRSELPVSQSDPQSQPVPGASGATGGRVAASDSAVQSGLNENKVEAYRAPPFCSDTGYALSNPGADPKPAGDTWEQTKQAGNLGALAHLAALNQTVGVPEKIAKLTLDELRAMPPLPGSTSEHVEYTSTLNDVTPEQAFRYFLDHPNDYFGAANITLYPPTPALADGARLFLQEPGVTPPVWAPVEVSVDEKARTVSFTTLDGHPLRGTNAFTFSESGNGTRMAQVSDFQLSSMASDLGGRAMKKGAELGLPVNEPIARQHEIWQLVHANVADNAGR
ncbi:MAG: DUF1990 family protein [Myxococcaceae bacterium]